MIVTSDEQVPAARRRSPTLGNAQRLNLLDASLMNMSFICCTLESIHPSKMNDNRYDALLMHPYTQNRWERDVAFLKYFEIYHVIFYLLEI